MKTNKLQVIKNNGVTFYVDDYRCCVDMDIEKNVEEVIVPEKIRYIMALPPKCFANVKTLCIGKDVETIQIENSMFPNVRKVKSDSPHFKDGTMLIESLCKGEVLKLDNSFCLKPEEVLDLSDITDIELHALSNCAAGAIVNCNALQDIKQETLLESDIPVEYLESCRVFMMGDIIVGFKPHGDCIIPSHAKCVAFGTEGPQYNETLLVECNKAINGNTILTYPTHVIFNGADHLNVDTLTNFRKAVIDFGPNITEYVKKDGIIYTSDMETLCLVDITLEGHIEIPDSVKTIYHHAFSGCKWITSVTIPDSVEKVGCGAFSNCNSLKHIHIGKNVKNMQSCFFHAGLTDVSFPGILETIADNMIEHCPALQYMKINEGTKKVLCRYQDTNHPLTLELPSTILKVSDNLMECISKLILHTEKIPESMIKQLTMHKLTTCKKLYFSNADFSYTKEEAIENYEIMCVETQVRTYYIPMCVTDSGAKKITDALEQAGSDTPANFYQYCKYAEQKLPFAFLEFQTNQDEKTKKFLKKNRKKIVNDLIERNLEEEVMIFLKFDILSKPMVKDVYDILAETNMEDAKDYAMQLMQKKMKK